MLETYRGPEAHELLQSHEFIAAWNDLHAACEWATCMQSVDFVTTWYRCYTKSYDPVVIVERDGSAVLTGVLFLAYDGRQLVHAGAFQAEYHVWLARQSDSRFIRLAMDVLSEMGFRQLTLLCVPHNAPIQALTSALGRRVTVRKVERPLMLTGEGSTVEESLRKKANKSRWNRLQRLGSLEFVQFESQSQLASHLADIAAFTDFRQGAMHGSCPFRDDPYKAQFFSELMAYPKLMHSTALLINGKTVATHIGMRNGDEVILGLIAHSPFIAEHSPGKLLLLKLGQLLGTQGFRALDLTPWGEYKDRFADVDDCAYVVTVFLSTRARYSSAAQQALVSAGARVLHRFGVQRQRITELDRTIRRKARAITVRAVISRARRPMRRFLGECVEMRVYAMSGDQALALPAFDSVRVNCLSDLLSYVPAEGWMPERQHFLRSAMQRIEAGAIPYTVVEDGALVHFGWLTPRLVESNVTEVGARVKLPPQSSVLWDYWTDPTRRGRGLYKRSLKQMCRDAALTGAERVYIVVLADNAPSRRAIENVGFSYEGSIYRTSRFRRSTIHATAVELIETPTTVDADPA